MENADTTVKTTDKVYGSLFAKVILAPLAGIVASELTVRAFETWSKRRQNKTTETDGK